MKKIGIPFLVILVFFAVGLYGTYKAMPTLAPGLVERTNNKLDSLAAVAEGREWRADSLARRPDSLLIQEALGANLVTLRDSVEFLEAQLRLKTAEQDTLMDRLAVVEERWNNLETKFNDAREISGTIVKLEDGELANLLNEVDPVVLEAIYLEATARNRARLLQMLPADKAAVIVNKMASPRPAPTPTASATATANALLNGQQ